MGTRFFPCWANGLTTDRQMERFRLLLDRFRAIVACECPCAVTRNAICQQLCSGKNESVDRWTLYIGAFCDLDAVRLNCEYRRLLYIWSVADDTSSRFNQKHY